jgi:hypothetical protein
MLVQICTATLTLSVEIKIGDEGRWKEKDNKMIKEGYEDNLKEEEER